MKKLILLLVLILCTVISAKQSSESDKKEMLKQFIIFQEAVKNKDSKVLASMIDLSVEYNNAIMLDSEGNFPKGVDFGTPLTEKLINTNIGRVIGNLQYLTYIKIDTATLRITDYFRDNASAKDKKRKYYQKGDEPGYYYKDKNNKEVYHTICDLKVNGEFSDNGILEIKSSSFSNKLTPLASEDCDSSIIYYFKLINNKLKLYEVKMAG